MIAITHQQYVQSVNAIHHWINFAPFKKEYEILFCHHTKCGQKQIIVNTTTQQTNQDKFI